MRPLGAGQGDGPGADLGGELPLDLACAVPEPHRKACDALPVDDAVPDKPHGPAHGVRAHVPLGRAGHGVRTAPSAGPEPGALGGGRGRVEADVLPFRRHRRAARPAVDPGGEHRRVEPAVEPGVLRLDGPYAALEFFLHAYESAVPHSALLAKKRHHVTLDLHVANPLTAATAYDRR